MTPRGMLTVTTVLLWVILGLLSPTPAALGSQAGSACCTRHNRKPVPFQRVKGYREQSTMENCRIEAIILYTVRGNEICVTRKDEWVRKILELLSSKLKKMSKAGSAKGKTQMGKSVNPSFNDGQGSFYSTTEAFPNSTKHFY